MSAPMTREQGQAIVDELREIKGLLRRLCALSDDDAERCPECGSQDLEDTSAMGDKRVTCHGCEKSFRPEHAATEAVNG